MRPGFSGQSPASANGASRLPRRARRPQTPAPFVEAEAEPGRRAPLVSATSLPPPAAAVASATPWVLSTYFAEGLPYSIVHQLAAQMFTFLGASLEAVGLTSLYGVAWNFKFVWSPLVDRYGTTRRWLVGCEIVLALLVLAIAWPAGRADLSTVARLLVAVSVTAATHDIAIDGFYLQALDKGRQAALSGVRVAAYRVAMMIGNSALVVLAGLTSWSLPFLVAGAALASLAAAHAFALPKASAVAPAAERTPLVDAFVSFVRQPRMVVSIPFILLFEAGDALMFNMNAPFLKALGLAAVGSGLISGSSTVAMIVGVLIGGGVIARYGLHRALVPIAIVQSLAILLYPILAAAPAPGTLSILLVMTIERFVFGLGTAGLLVFLMRRCQPEHKAAHYACASAIMSLGPTLAGVSSGYLARTLGFPVFFTIAFAVSIPGVVLSVFAPKDGPPR